jgi:hypothetical protein
LQVQSGNVKSGDIRDLPGTMTLENAVIEIFITSKKTPKRCSKQLSTRGYIKVNI